MKKIATALISVHDKTNLVDLAAFLSKKGVEIIASTPTCKMLDKNGVKAQDLATVTGHGETLDGSIEAMHPIIFGGVMALRRESSHTEQLKNIGGQHIDLVIANPAPFDAVTETGGSIDDSVSAADVATLSLIRAAARNFRDVAVLTNPAQYAEFMDEFTKTEGKPSVDFCRKLAVRAFELSASYDMDIYNNMNKELRRDEFLPQTLFLKYSKAMELRYGENPHQRAAFFREPDLYGVSLAEAEMHKGGPIPYNMAYDLNLALEIVMEFDKPAVAVVKQGVPLGVALEKDLVKAYLKARDVEPASAVGAVVAFNGQVEKRAAKEITATYNEAIIASRYTEGALELLRSAKKAANMRVLQIVGKKWTKQAGTLNLRSVLGGVLVQENDDLLLPEGAHLKVLSKRKPTRKQLADLILAWKVVKHVGSNAVVLAKDLQTIGTGANQINRMDAMRIAFEKAGDESVGCVMAFDTFIPMRNIIDEASRYGITAIIQPGGALRDDEIGMACDEHNIALGLTGMRHFKH